QGHLGIEPFRHLLNDRRFRKTPMYLETPKGDRNGTPWDVVNLRKLRRLIEK
ncbi:MAG: deoxyribonuclease IV, partial [Planctomycetota bacterium]